MKLPFVSRKQYERLLCKNKLLEIMNKNLILRLKKSRKNDNRDKKTGRYTKGNQNV